MTDKSRHRCLRAEVCLHSPDGIHCPDPAKFRLRHDADCHQLSARRQGEMIEPEEGGE